MKKFLNAFKAMPLAVLVLFAVTIYASADDVTLQWDANSPAPDGYRVFVRDIQGNYDYTDRSNEVSGQTTTATVTNLVAGNTYAFVVRAFVGQNESGDSNEVVYQVPLGPPQQIIIPHRVTGITILFQTAPPVQQSN